MPRSFVLAATALATFAVSTPAVSTTYSTATLASAREGLQMMRELNVITYGDLSSGNHVQGKAFVGGSLTGAGNSATFGQGNTSVGAAASTRATLTVAGDVRTGFTLQGGQNGSAATAPKSAVIGGSLTNTTNTNPDGWTMQVGGNLAAIQNVNGGGPITYGGTYGGTSTGNGRIARDASIGTGGANDLGAALATQAATMRTDLDSLSTVLAGLASNGTVTTSGSNITFDFSNTGSDAYGAYTISAATLFSYNGALGVILGSTAKPVVINVTGGGSYTDSLNMNLSDAIATQVIFNFVDATNLAINANWTGSILATKAAITNSSNITGSVVAKTLTQNAEVHLGTYAGSDAPVPAPAVTPAPEPGTWTLAVVGFGLLGGALRRRPRRVAA